MAAQRFLIYAQPRTGSTWLVDLLNSHPEIECDSELFNDDYQEMARRLWSRRLLRKYPIPYMQVRAKTCPYPAYGFKLLHYQTRRSIDLLAKLHQRGWHIISLRRNQLWNQAVSDVLAIQTRKYHRTGKDEARVNPNTVELDASPSLMLLCVWQLAKQHGGCDSHASRTMFVSHHR